MGQSTKNSISAFVRGLAPQWDPWQWLFWPPDCFALTSILMRQTGSYRHVVSREFNARRALTWQAGVEHAADAWGAWINQLLVRQTSPDAATSDPRRFLEDAEVKVLATAFNDYVELSNDVSFNDLRLLATDEARRLCDALITIHSVADEACSGFGLVAGAGESNALVHYLGNLLLTAQGTLSSLPKHQGIVLPKMRTPQSGLTLRSMSHHLTYHSTEVEVMWRSMPWANIDENTINLLAVPWPQKVVRRSFRPARETFESVRYFDYEPDSRFGADKAKVDGRMAEVVKLIRKLNAERGRIHIVVFPELSLSRGEYESLMWQLWDLHDRRRSGESEFHVPIIVAGVRDVERDGAGDESPLNEVRLAAYFAGRWYDLSQRKHHRWRLNRSQVLQYGLQGALTTSRHWYEKIPVDQRRLTFLVPNGWLSLCPLICEDLAQLEPVSEVIRGVGPTLLTALLMDGPQLKERWPARYASVLAEDPGTAVLSLTSLGMAEKSRIHQPGQADTPKSRTVGLWKDQMTQWATLDVPIDRGAVLLTISADQVEEFTADGRSDHKHAAAFRFEGAHYPQLEDIGGAEAEATTLSPGGRSAKDEKDKWLGSWADIRELSAATYALDALISVRGKDIDLIAEWLLASPVAEHKAPARYREMLSSIRAAQKQPATAGILTREMDNWPTRPLTAAVGEMKKWFTRQVAPGVSRLTYWSDLVDEACRFLRDPHHQPLPLNQSRWVIRRVQRSVRIAVLSVLHSRLERERRALPLPHSVPVTSDAADPSHTNQHMSNLLKKIEEELVKHL